MKKEKNVKEQQNKLFKYRNTEGAMLKRIKDKITYELGKRKNRRLEASWRKRLKADNFTILCPNCIGGIIYHRLGKQFLSPTVNLFLSQRDFIKFAVGLEHYLGQELQFIETEQPFPVARLDDITLNFNHFGDEKEAAEAWNRRKSRINRENIYIIFYYREKCSLEELREIEKATYKNLILLTDTPLDLEYAYCIKENVGRLNSQTFLDQDKYGIRTFEKQWDFVSWLNEPCGGSAQADKTPGRLPGASGGG